MKLTKREMKELEDAIKITKLTGAEIRKVLDRADAGMEIDDKDLWELKNFANQIEAVLYNVHHGVYRKPTTQLGVR